MAYMIHIEEGRAAVVSIPTKHSNFTVLGYNELYCILYIVAKDLFTPSFVISPMGRV